MMILCSFVFLSLFQIRFLLIKLFKVPGVLSILCRLVFLVIISNTFSFYKPFQGLKGHTQRIFVTFNDEVDGVIKKLSFEDEFMTKILAKEVIPGNQGMIL